MEHFDLIDKNGKELGVKKARSAVHRDGDWHRAVNIWILNSKNEVLIQKRSSEKDSYPNFWDISCAGHVDAGESPIQTAIREAKEELGLNIEANELTYLFSVSEEHFLNNNTFIDREIREVYMLRVDWPLSNFKLQKEEVAELKWISLEELEKMVKSKNKDLVPHDKEYPKLFPIPKELIV